MECLISGAGKALASMSLVSYDNKLPLEMKIKLSLSNLYNAIYIVYS